MQDEAKFITPHIVNRVKDFTRGVRDIERRYQEDGTQHAANSQAGNRRWPVRCVPLTAITCRLRLEPGVESTVCLWTPQQLGSCVMFSDESR
ncbi:hypothetical protein AVEN_179460-1 [Araneus ventricosus]|uniref:Uncharacterized protein n=1 Tax=Araneus ventricosus TaxID=182803 RepID=A0A4Y2BGM1_ARAVE|nr:hypothetical protein AVEN_179460-1 [Araneus ventricosus]